MKMSKQYLLYKYELLTISPSGFLIISRKRYWCEARALLGFQYGTNHLNEMLSIINILFFRFEIKRAQE